MERSFQRLLVVVVVAWRRADDLECKFWPRILQLVDQPQRAVRIGTARVVPHDNCLWKSTGAHDLYGSSSPSFWHPDD